MIKLVSRLMNGVFQPLTKEPPCPVCKQKGKSLEVEDWGFGKYAYIVYCANCGIVIKNDFGINLRQIINIIETFKSANYEVNILSRRLEKAIKSSNNKTPAS